MERFGRKTEEVGKDLKKYEKKAQDTAGKIGDQYQTVKKKLASDDEKK